MPTRLAPLAILLVAVAACSQSGPTTSTATTPTTATTTTTTTQPAVASTTAAPPTTSTTVAPTTTTTTTIPPAPLEALAWEVIADGFVRPNYMLPLPGTKTLLVALADGTAWPLTDNQVGDEPYLDLSDVVKDNGIEQGLLGLAFHPSDPSRLFAYYTGPDDDAHLAELQATAEGADSARVLLSVAQPTERHQAGMIQFGPDGFLYLSIGDGGDGGSQGQNPESLLGTIVRLDVDAENPYAVPADNPFVDGGGAPEVIAYGLRNPWRFGIDHVAEVVYIGDVGQDDWEEINVMPLDLEPYNFGWPLTEGAHCFAKSGCDPTSFSGPAVEFSHDDGCSVTGGFVYRGRAIPEIVGHYFYSDWCGQWVRSFVYAEGGVTDDTEWEDLDRLGQINSFGLDVDGELLAATWGGVIARVVPIRQE